MAEQEYERESTDPQGNVPAISGGATAARQDAKTPQARGEQPTSESSTVTSGVPGAAHDEIFHADGSSARASTQGGVLNHDDVENAPLLRGTDPMSDDAIERRHGGPLSSQGIIFAVLGVVFAVFFISDLAHGEWGRAVLGAVVLAICAAAIMREVQARKR